MSGATGTIEAAFRGSLGGFSLDAAFTVPARGVTGLFGPSGSGKTSVLRCIAGLQRVADGRCVVDGDVWQDAATFRPTHRRPISYVFQEASLFPHLSVRRNLLFGAPKAAGERRIAFDEVVEMFGIAPLLERAPANLSGGERQRVAIGRALLSQPSLLLMDEPLSALDRQTKDEILPFLERLHDTLSLPVLYVSHDMAEIERLADHLVLIDEGRVVASGPLAELQSDPALPLAAARDAAVGLDAVVDSWDEDYGLLSLTVEGATFRVPAVERRRGSRVRLRIAAGDVSLTRGQNPESTILNVLPARIVQTRRNGNEMILVLGLGSDGTGARLLARVTRLSWERLKLSEGERVDAQVKSVALAR